MQEVQDQRDDLERVNKQLRLEMEQLVNQQDDVGKNVGLFWFFCFGFWGGVVLGTFLITLFFFFRSMSSSGPGGR